MVIVLLISIISFVLTVFCVKLSIKIGYKFEIIDTPGYRKIHKSPIPRSGGMAFFVSFFMLVLFLILLKIYDFKILKGAYLSLIIIFLLGIYDDVKGANAKVKFLFQILSASLLWYNGLRIDRITNPFGGEILITNNVLSLVITVFWVVSLINAINLLDGMDGLAAGVILISSVFIFIIAGLSKNIDVLFLASMLIGITSGFLVFNFPPAKIFMGDTGSMFLGFMMAVLGIIGNRKSAVAITLLVPIVLLLIPIIDTGMAILRRLKQRKNIFQADKEHIHHRLLALGIGYKKVLLIIYMINIYLGLIALLSLFFRKEYIFILFIVLFLGIFILLEILRFVEKKSKIKN